MGRSPLVGVNGVLMPPVFTDVEKTQMAWILHWVSATVAVVGSVAVGLLLLLLPEYGVRWLLCFVIVNLVALAVHILNRRGSPRAAGVLLTVAIGVSFTIAAWTSGGVSAPAVMAELATIMLAGLVLGWRSGVFAAVASQLAVFFLAYAQTIGLISDPIVAHTAWSRAITFASFAMALAVLQALVVVSLGRAHERTAHELEEREAAERRLRDVIDHAPFGSVLFESLNNGQLIVVGANSAAEEILGMPIVAYRGLSIEEVFPMLGGEALQAAFRETARDGVPVEADTFSLTDGDFGRVLEVHAFQTARDRMAVFFRDVTEDRHAQESVRQINAELEDRVAVRTAELRAANASLIGAVESLQQTNRQLDEATKAQNRFLANMSHELRTPLNSIIGFAGVLAQQLPGDLNHEQLRQVNMISSSGRRLLELVNQVLDISRIQDVGLEMNREVFDATEVARNVASILAPLARTKDLVTECHCAGPVIMTSDRARIEQVILNLAGNAIKFTDSGKVSLSIDREAGDVVFRVADTGHGIDAEDLPRVFERFYQAPPSEGGKHEGSGLGLAVSRQIVDLLGGTIDVTSTPGVGSTFTVRLPAGDSPDA